MTQPAPSLREETKKSLQRIQVFDTSALPRRDALGTELCFDAAVGHADRLIYLYKKLSLSALEDMPDAYLTQIKDAADGDYAVFNAILNYKAENGKAARDNLIASIKSRYVEVFQSLHPLISYSMHKATDFDGLEAKARAVMQQVSDKSEEQLNEINKIKDEALSALNAAKTAAQEHGVTQQAVYFKDESAKHTEEANRWFKYSAWVAGASLLYAISTFFIHKIPWLTPGGVYESVQLSISKIIVFAVILYALYYCVRNYMANKHNEILNKHRQNALMTYRAIVEAAGQTANTDIILVQAAACIFSPQNSGFSGSHTAAQVSNSAIELLMKPFQGGASASA